VDEPFVRKKRGMGVSVVPEHSAIETASWSAVGRVKKGGFGGVSTGVTQPADKDFLVWAAVRAALRSNSSAAGSIDIRSGRNMYRN
jgi:hypothetical protein